MNFYSIVIYENKTKDKITYLKKYFKKIIRVCIKGIFLQSYAVQFYGQDKNTLKRNALQSIKGG